MFSKKCSIIVALANPVYICILNFPISPNKQSFQKALPSTFVEFLRKKPLKSIPSNAPAGFLSYFINPNINLFFGRQREIRVVNGMEHLSMHEKFAGATAISKNNT